MGNLGRGLLAAAAASMLCALLTLSLAGRRSGFELLSGVAGGGLSGEVAAVGEAHQRLVHRARVLQRSIRSLTQAVKRQEDQMEGGKASAKLNADELAKDVAGIRKEFGLVRKAEAVPESNEGARDKPLLEKGTKLEAKADQISKRARLEMNKAMAERVEQKQANKSYSELVAKVSVEKEKLEVRERQEEKLAAARKAREAKETMDRAEAASKQLSRAAAKTKALAQQHTKSNAQVTQDPKVGQSKEHHSRTASSAPPLGPDPDRAADAVVQEEEAEHLVALYQRWSARGGSGGHEGIDAFCATQSDVKSRCIRDLHDRLPKMPRGRSHGEVEGDKFRQEEEDREQANKERGGRVCDPTSASYLDCLGVRGTGATLSSTATRGGGVSMREAKRLVERGIENLVARKQREAREAAARASAANRARLQIDNESWGGGPGDIAEKARKWVQADAEKQTKAMARLAGSKGIKQPIADAASNSKGKVAGRGRSDEAKLPGVNVYRFDAS